MQKFIEVFEKELDRLNEMLEDFHGEASADYFDDDGKLIIKLTGKTSSFNYKGKQWKIDPAATDIQQFANEIKAYFFDMLDTAFNL